MDMADKGLGGRSRHWPLAGALLLYLGTVGILYLLVMRRTGGRLIYTLDDCYIHMAMAKAFSQSGTWGLTVYGFSSSSSSPLWVLLLSSAYYVFGVNDASPLILNVLPAVAAIFLAYRILLVLMPAPKPSYIFIALMSVMFAAELPSLAFAGMEHSLQILIVLAFTHFAAGMVSKEEAGPRMGLAWLLALSMLATFIRYESLALVLIVSILLAMRRRWGRSAAVLLAGIAPPAIVGAISRSHGAYLLPNSVKIKAFFPGLNSLTDVYYFLTSLYAKLFHAPEMLLLIMVALALFTLDFKADGRVYEYKRGFIIIFLATAFLQAQFSFVGYAGVNMYFYRYEAYLVMLGLLTIWMHLFGYLPKAIPQFRPGMLPKYAGMLMLASFPVFSLGANCGYLSRTPTAAGNIYQQQYQMGLFIRQYYQHRTVALNDIGVVNYLADVRLVDLVGLGSDNITRLRIENAKTINGILIPAALTSEQIYNFARDADVAMVYDEWFPGAIPAKWVKVGEWEIPDNVTCALPVVSIYAVNPAKKDELVNNLHQFSIGLPREVQQRYL